MVDEKTRELYFEIAIGAGAENLKDLRLKMGEGIAGWVAEHGERVLVEEAQHGPALLPKFDEMTQHEHPIGGLRSH